MIVEIERLKKEIKMLESQKKGLEFSLAHRKNRLRAEERLAEDKPTWVCSEMEKEKTPAEKWVDGTFDKVDEKRYFKVFPIQNPPPYTYLKSHMMRAHEAGQKYAKQESEPEKIITLTSETLGIRDGHYRLTPIKD